MVIWDPGTTRACSSSSLDTEKLTFSFPCSGTLPRASAYCPEAPTLGLIFTNLNVRQQTRVQPAELLHLQKQASDGRGRSLQEEVKNNDQVENFPKMGKEIIPQVQETQRVPNRCIPSPSATEHLCKGGPPPHRTCQPLPSSSLAIRSSVIQQPKPRARSHDTCSHPLPSKTL